MSDDLTEAFNDPGEELPAEWINRVKITTPGYRLFEEIARGGQAVVYRAEQISTKSTVAMKVLREGPLADEHARERLRREARILAVLKHPNIPHLVEFLENAAGYDFLAMEYIVGKRLDVFLFGADGAPARASDPADVLRLFLKICDAVAEAHQAGIVHRDLSPSNILIDGRCEPHVLDFGLARTEFERFMCQAGAAVSVPGNFLGKLAYASPEQAEAHPEKIDIRTDVYALGVILYQILTGGEFPYEVVGTLADILHNIAYTPPMPPSDRFRNVQSEDGTVRHRLRRCHPPAVNPVIEAIVLKALKKRPQDRYGNAGELRDDIENYLAGRPTRAGIERCEPVAAQGPPDWVLWIAITGLLITLAWTARVQLWPPRPATPTVESERPNDKTAIDELLGTPTAIRCPDRLNT